MITEQYVTFETARMLKEAGFRDKTKTHYSNSGEVWETEMPADYNDDFNCNTCNRPTQSLAARWLRETHKICLILTPMTDGWMYDLYDLKKCQYIILSKDTGIVTYETAFEEALQECLNLIIRKQ